jgi:UDP-glucose 4-epimerase
MKILVIGSKGFIGNHLLDFFRARGNDAYGCDVVVEYNDAKYFQVDATNAFYEEIFAETQFDVCINASGAASVPDSFVHSFRDYRLNTYNIFVILESIRKFQPGCKFLNLSSAAVYGNPNVLPVKETMAAKPLSPYGWHKFYSEQICEEFHRFYNLSTCSVRIFSAFGPGLRKQLFWDWYQKSRQSKSITLFGTGNESRDFIFIDDILFAIECVLTHSPFEADIVNVANGEEVRISSAIDIFVSNLKTEIAYAFNNEVRVGDPLNWRADISRLNSFGYSQKVSFSEGVSQYLKWIKELS